MYNNFNHVNSNSNRKSAILLLLITVAHENLSILPQLLVLRTLSEFWHAGGKAYTI